MRGIILFLLLGAFVLSSRGCEKKAEYDFLQATSEVDKVKTELIYLQQSIRRKQHDKCKINYRS